jgi:hypothetical protein
MTKSQSPARALTVFKDDLVAHVLEDVRKGQLVNVSGHANIHEVIAAEDIAAFHKIALSEIAEDDIILRGTCKIGRSVDNIKAGDWVHVHNMTSLRAKSSKG